MIRKALILTLALAVPTGAGCVVHASGEAKSGEGGEEAPPPPPPPPPPPAAEAPKKEVPEVKQASKVTVDKGKISIPGNIVFDTGKATLKQGAGSEEVLKQLKQYLDDTPRVTQLRVEGHTDNVGQPADNIELSGQRALTIKKWLMAEGIKEERVLAVGFGQDRPIADNGTDAGRSQNRRTEFHIAMIDGNKFMGMDPSRGGKVFK